MTIKPEDRDKSEIFEVNRREFLEKGTLLVAGWFLLRVSPAIAADKPGKKLWVYAVDTTKCIGCGSCMRGCRAENDVPEGYYRTWVERYEIDEHGHAHVDIALNDRAVFDSNATEKPRKSFFVPKICNHCEQSVCSQVCPVGATFRTEDGVVLVDHEHCVGCGYCVQACPYSTRFINPRTHTADKCTLCYHRLSKGETTACVQSCPVGARMVGDANDPDSQISYIMRERRYTLIKPELGTKPRCLYIGLDMEVI